MKWERFKVDLDDERTPPYRVMAERSGYVMSVDVSVVDGRPVVVGMSAVRASGRRKTDSTGKGSLSLREVRRLPFATFLEAARSAVAVVHRNREGGIGTHADFIRAIKTARAPRGSPPRGDRGMAWWQKLANAYRALEETGEPNPGATLAKRMGVSPATMRVWVHRARHERGLLDPPSRA